VEEKRAMIETKHPVLSIKRQCELVGLCRSLFYYQPSKASEAKLKLMAEIDSLYLKCPFYATRKMTEVLKAQGYEVNRKRIKRLYQLMGIQAIGPKPNTSKPMQGHKIYPYLLRNLKIERIN
jgi:putative transposase